MRGRSGRGAGDPRDRRDRVVRARLVQAGCDQALDRTRCRAGAVARALRVCGDAAAEPVLRGAVRIPEVRAVCAAVRADTGIRDRATAAGGVDGQLVDQVRDRTAEGEADDDAQALVSAVRGWRRRRLDVRFVGERAVVGLELKRSLVARAVDLRMLAT